MTPERRLVASTKTKKLILSSIRNAQDRLYNNAGSDSDDSDICVIKKKPRKNSSMTDEEFMNWVSVMKNNSLKLLLEYVCSIIRQY